MPNKLLVGGSWLIAGRAVERIIGLLSIAILARLLIPADFGVVAVAGTVVAAVEILSAFGFDWALVRHRDPTDDYLNTAWTLRVGLGVLTLGALVLIGPAAAAFYHLSALRPVLAVMGLASLAASLENIGTVYFRRDFAFHKEFLLRAISKVCGFLATISIALAYPSYWALVVGIIFGKCATTIASYLLHPYRPKPSLAKARALFGFSAWLLLSKIIDYCLEQFSTLYLGRVFGARVNGLFAMAGEMSQVPITEVAAPVNRVAYSQYSADVRVGHAIEGSYVGIASLIWLIALPMTAGTIAVADEAVALLLGPHWHDAVPVVRLLAIGTAFAVMVANTHYVYWALGMPRLVAALSATGALMIVPTTIVGGHLAGYEGVALAYAVTNGALVPVNFSLLKRFGRVGFGELWARTWRVTLGALVMLTVLWVAFPEPVYTGSAQAAAALALKVLAGAAIYVLIVVGSWAICGKPDGPEKSVLRALRAWMTGS